MSIQKQPENPNLPNIVTIEHICNWFAAQKWNPFPFQQKVWKAMQAGESGLLHASTGSGKTLAVWLGALLHLAKFNQAKNDQSSIQSGFNTQVLWVTPMRALAADTALALKTATDALCQHYRIGVLTGDTPSAVRSSFVKKPPTALITTPESLSLMLTRPNHQTTLQTVQVVIVDEWHELIGSKRGVQLQLALAYSVRLNPKLLVWGLSATLGCLTEAMKTLLHPLPNSAVHNLIEGNVPKKIIIDCLIPKTMERFPWAGHLGLKQLTQVVQEVSKSASTLIFTNTRSQAEIWYQAILEAKPEWAGVIALHHSSLDSKVRAWVEQGLKQGVLKAVVCTSSLDLGVDFLPVERVLHIGSPKGIARLLQRAGRSGHAPGKASRVTIVPTHALELLEAAAARHAAKCGHIEARHTPRLSIDVLVQHIVTRAMGAGFIPDELYAEVCGTAAYHDLPRTMFDWAVAFAKQGGQSLTAYPDYQRIAQDEHGIYRVPRHDIAKRHAMIVGTIMANASMVVAWGSGAWLGKKLGNIEENFIARLKPGDCFTFAGRVLELIRVRDMTAFVRKANRNKAAVPQWQGGKMPLSSELARATLDLLTKAEQAMLHFAAMPNKELKALNDLLKLQMQISALPTASNLLIEAFHSKEGHHLFVYLFAGRLVHTGLASLFAWRASKHKPNTFSMATNDYGFELLSAKPIDWHEWIDESKDCPLFSTQGLQDDIMESINATELAERRFREIARIAGLVFQGYPGANKSTKQLQASSSLFFEVFQKYDPENLLLQQAKNEILQHELDFEALKQVLVGMQQKSILFKSIKTPSPLSFPLIVERLRERVSTESLSDRVARMIGEIEKSMN